MKIVQVLMALLFCGGLVQAQDAQLLAQALQNRCVHCHGPQKSKARLRLDQAAGLRSVVVAGEATESELFRRVSLAADHEDYMPSKGEGFGDEELLALLRWINTGADADAVARAASKLRGAAEAAALLVSVGAASGTRITPLSMDPAGDLRVDYSLAKSPPSAEQLAALAPLAERIVELSLAGQQGVEASLASLPTLAKLERLHLERTGVGDASLAALIAGSSQLRYVNLHSTAVSAAALSDLQKLAKLERLVLFDTAIEAEQLRAIHDALPELQVTAELRLPGKPFSHGGPRRLLAADASKGRIALLRETALKHWEVLWEHPIQSIHDLHELENGNVLFQSSWTQILEVNPENGELLWSYDAATQNRALAGEAVEVHAFQRLAAGVTMIAESGPARIIEVDRAGKLLRSMPMQVEHPSAHSDTRLVRVTDAGTYLVAHERDGWVREYQKAGSLIWSYDVPLFDREPAGGHGPEAWGDQVFAALRLAGGNTLIATGNGHRVLEVNPAGEIVWQLTQDELPGIRLAWVTTLQVLENGNLVIGNCHAGEGQPQVIEITRAKDVVWSFQDFERFGNSLSNSLVLER
jgi:outer membrane protein assembly factor BamB